MCGRKRVLISAYYCSPWKGGEAAVGWRYAVGLSKAFDVTVIVGDLSAEMPMKADLERKQREGGLPEGLTVIHVPPDGATIRLHELHRLPGCWVLYYRAYRRWQRLAYDKARELHQANPFDLAHQLTIIGYREPGMLWQLGIPFAWGPINGAAGMPWRFVWAFGAAGIYRHVTRNVLNSLQMRLPSRARAAARHASKIWAVTGEDEDMVCRIWKRDAETMIETGAVPDAGAVVRHRKHGEPLRLIWCGIIEDRKALPLAIKALGSKGEAANVELHVIGDGPDRGRCEALGLKVGLSEVHFHGRVAHAEVRNRMLRGHALIHPALKEGTPHVVLEAMALGLPVLCHDACGMAIAVDETCGIKVPMRSPRESVDGFRSAVLRLLTEDGLLERLSEGAIARSRVLSWDAKVEVVGRVYGKILESEGP